MRTNLAFLSSFDPSDLPGSSVDPMGFERGYLFLADQILPGLTNVANQPRYLSLLCAGVPLAEVEQGEAPRNARAKRRETALRFERFWALANVLAAGRRKEECSGLRGVTYALAEAESLDRRSATSCSSKFRLLSRQEPYGALGIYGAVAEQMRLLERTAYGLTPDSGERLAEAFFGESQAPDSLKRAVRENGEVGLATLAKWGEKAFLTADPGPVEGRLLGDALFDEREMNRGRTARLLQKYPLKQKERELEWLERVSGKLSEKGEDADLRAAMRAILAYERCYRLTLMAFERILMGCRQAATGLACAEELAKDDALREARKRLPAEIQNLTRTLDELQKYLQAVGEWLRIQDTRGFLDSLSATCDSGTGFIDALIDRHSEIQSGKWDGGHKKSSWVKRGDKGLSLTILRVGRWQREVTAPENIPAHEYRLRSVLALLEASRSA